MYALILCFLTAFMLTYIAIPSIINIAKVKNLVDVPDHRRSHKTTIPTLGGIGIFSGVLFAIIMWTPFRFFGALQYILCAMVILFLIGAKDDILPLTAYKKLTGQILAAGILFFLADVRLTSLYGIFGIYEIPFWFSIVFTIFTILVILNSFNLIDGINGLSASLGILISVILGYWFYRVDHVELAMIAAALTGALLAFLRYNITPAKIFMGDTGSLLIGLICAILTINFIELHRTLGDSEMAFKAAPATAFGLLILPLFDTLRVFIIRIVQGRSPFHADRSHIHHLLIDVGLSHMQATSLLIAVNALFIFIVVSLQDVGNLNLLIIILSVAILLTILLQLIIKNKNKARIKS